MKGDSTNSEQVSQAIATGIACTLAGTVLAVPFVGFAPLGVALAGIVAVAVATKALKSLSDNSDD